MRPLLRPARQPHPETLVDMLGMCGRVEVLGRSGFETSAARLLRELLRLTSSEGYRLEQDMVGRESNLRTYHLESQRGSGGMGFSGSVSLAHSGQQYSVTAKVLWSQVRACISELIDIIDRIWRCEEWSSLYVYDQDDFSLQNIRGVPAMRHCGIDRDQVELINPFGIADEIDTRANPGYLLNHGGDLLSVQWLNYWSSDSQGRIFTEPPRDFPPGVDVSDLGHGSFRVRLSDSPGRFDDVEFHRRQLECRCRLPFVSSFKLPADVENPLSSGGFNAASNAQA
jgi:hypothetical protein